MSKTLEVRLPAMTATMEEATIIQWLVEPGDHVSEGHPIAEISTDKVDMELPSPYEGTVVEILVGVGSPVPLGTPIISIASEAVDLLAGLTLDLPGTTTPSPPSPVAPAVSTATETKITPASPPARRLARKMGIDLAEVTPTGKRGQVTSVDVTTFVQASKVPAAAPLSSPPVASTAPTSQDDRKLSVRRATAEIMGRAARIPQFTLYRLLMLDYAATHKAGRSWTTELVRSLAAALREHPEMNSQWDEESRRPVSFDTVRVGIAVDRPQMGLVVVSVADPDVGDPDDADRRVRGVMDRARNGAPVPSDLEQPSITLSNLGGLGVDRFAAVVFPPQASILSVGTIRMRPVATSDGALKAALTCEVGLTVDHRAADGADGARFLETFTRYVED